MASKANELQPTRGRFSLVGIVKNLHGDKSYASGVSDNTGNEWHKINFGVQTNSTNTVYLELMGSMQDEIYATKTNEDNTRTNEKFDWDDRYDLPQGYHMIGVRCFIEPDGKKGFENENKHPFDAVEYIREHLDDGDWVTVRGNIEYSVYTNPQTKQVVHQHKFIPNYIAKITTPVEFDNEKFEEVSAFQQEFVVLETNVEKKENKALVSAYVIKKEKGEMKWVPATFNIDGEVSPKMISAFPSKMKFGDVVTVNGEIINGVVVEEVVEEEDEFGSKTPTGLNRKGKSRISELRITGIEKDSEGKHKWKKKHYTEDQFVGSQAEDDFGSSTKKDPFVDIKDDDLPF